MASYQPFAADGCGLTSFSETRNTMKLKVRSINHAAFLIALLVTLVVIVAGNIVASIYDFYWWGVLTICIATFIVTWLFTRLVIKRGYLIETATQKMADQVERLEEMERFRREYLGNFAHEIKTPVFNVQGYVQTLLDGGLEDSNINRLYLERAERSIERIVGIVNYLDEISRLSSGAPRLDTTSFDIVALTREVIEGSEMEAATRNIRVVLSTRTPRSVMVTADRKYVSQVLVNLVSNSLRYGTAGGRTRISIVDQGEKVRVDVADNGEGIDEEDLPRIFERFFRADASRSRSEGGTGLGLAIVKHILEAHGETISVASELGVGSTFSFTLTKF